MSDFGEGDEEFQFLRTVSQTFSNESYYLKLVKSTCEHYFAELL